MIFRLLLFLVAYGAAIGIPGGLLAYGGYRLLKPKLDERKRKLEAAKRALLLEAHREQCVICLEHVDEAADCFKEHLGWFHDRCMKALKG